MIQGFLELISHLQVRGWAYDADRPQTFLTIEICCNGALLGSTVANLYRHDLEVAGVGTGSHAFILNLDSGISEADFPNTTAFALDQAGEKIKLYFVSPRTDASHSMLSQSKLEFGEATSDAKKVPVFILGAARSGTSAMAQALLQLPRFGGEEEGHLLDLLAHFSVCLENFYGRKADELDRHTMVANVPRKYFDDAVDHMFCELAKLYFQQTYWVEKTPNSDSINIAPRFRQIWPRAKFIFMKRRGLENIRSRQAKFPGIDFASYCTEWASAMTAWRLVRDQLTGCAIEVDQLYVAQQPKDAAEKLGQFLELDQLEIGRLGQFFCSERPQRTAADIACVIEPAAMGWDATMWSTFKEICAESMNAFGYGLGSEYFQSETSDSMFKAI